MTFGDHSKQREDLIKAQIADTSGENKGGRGSGRHKEKLTPISEEERSANESQGKAYDNTRDPKSAMYEKAL